MDANTAKFMNYGKTRVFVRNGVTMTRDSRYEVETARQQMVNSSTREREVPPLRSSQQIARDMKME